MVVVGCINNILLTKCITYKALIYNFVPWNTVFCESSKQHYTHLAISMSIIPLTLVWGLSTLYHHDLFCISLVSCGRFSILRLISSFPFQWARKIFHTCTFISYNKITHSNYEGTVICKKELFCLIQYQLLLICPGLVFRNWTIDKKWWRKLTSHHRTVKG